jgi:hypothetical protein
VVRLLTLLVVPHRQDRQDWVAIALVVVAAIIVVLWRGGEGCRGIWKGVEEVTIKCEALSLTTDDEGVIIMVVSCCGHWLFLFVNFFDSNPVLVASLLLYLEEDRR